MDVIFILHLTKLRNYFRRYFQKPTSPVQDMLLH